MTLPLTREEPASPAEAPSSASAPTLAVRLTHWIFALAFFAFLFSSLPILIAHPHFYWGEVGGFGARPLFSLPLPLRPGRSGWGRNLHFLAAWISLFTGLVYVAASVLSGHLRRDLLPSRSQLAWRSLREVLIGHLKLHRGREASSYNTLQRIAYLAVVFVLFPAMAVSGLAMSPAVTSVVPQLVQICGGHQSARTLHFAFTLLFMAFFAVHVLMVALSGFVPRMRAMITGRASAGKA